MQNQDTPKPPADSDQTADRVGVGRCDLFAVGDTVEITANCMTKGKTATVIEHCMSGKIEVSFGPQWAGWYYPSQLRNLSCERLGRASGLRKSQHHTNTIK